MLQVHGGWSNWQPLDVCSTTCGNGVQRMIRYCDSPAAQNGGRHCPGSSTMSVPCEKGPCPSPTTSPPRQIVNGGWGVWQPLDLCSTTCGNGVQRMIRYCDSPAAQNGGRYCPGSSRMSVLCDKGPCPSATEIPPSSMTRKLCDQGTCQVNADEEEGSLLKSVFKAFED